MRVVWHWYSMGPYHFARMAALARVPGIELTVIETSDLDDHEWVREKNSGFDVITLSSAMLSKLVFKDTTSALTRVLSERKPDVVVAAGYANPHTLRAMLAYRAAHPDSLVLVWSESTIVDQSRRWLGERLKVLFLSVFDGALVAGRPHARYMQRLRMPESQIQAAGNCVDNEFFSDRTDALRKESAWQERSDLPQNFFLFVGRMIPAKNLGRLIESYRGYRERAGAAAWDLVLVGTGPEEAALRKQASGLPGVRFAGLQQIGDLPHYYGRAKCFVLPSTSEPWGLVVNEAMACGVPVLVSSRAGCVEDLVRDGHNGFVFDPLDSDGLAELMLRVSSGSVPLEQLGAAGRRIISDYTPSHFAERATRHFDALYRQKCQRPRLVRERMTSITRNAVSLITQTWGHFC